MAANANRAVPEWIAYAKDVFAPLKMEIARQKMAGLEYGPAKKKVKTFRGEHRSAKWEETAERFYLFELISKPLRQMAFQKHPKRQKFVLRDRYEPAVPISRISA
ncbi:hypothetical protein NKH52_20255 [Mesorhizobium sp. M1066]|uniref:hypothetical protein n=1 Tax=unclassified Mesorhizobium TaxID=325217 RepID=UPI00333BD2CF